MHKIKKEENMLFEDALREPIKFENPQLPKALYKFGEEHRYSRERMKEAFDQGSLRALDNHEWQFLQGSQSWNIQTLDDIKKLDIDFTREFNTLQKAMKYKNTVEAPTVIQIKNTKPVLLDGDIWLMCMKAMGIKPMVYWVNL